MMSKDEWQELIEELKENGLTPDEVRRILIVYNSAKAIDEETKKHFNQQENP
jgi:DNA-binding transcriptional MerR regulator